jgi:CBS domain-containing protein
MEFEPVWRRMRRVVISAAPADSLLHAAQLMQLARIRHLPVLQDDCLVGILSHGDVLEAATSPLEEASLAKRIERLRATPVSRVMHRSVCTIESDATLRDVAERMLRYKIRCLPVVDGKPGARGAVIGLITESDLLAAAYLPERDPRTLFPHHGV